MGTKRRVALGGIAWASLVAAGLGACGGGGDGSDDAAGGMATGSSVSAAGGSSTLLANCEMFPAQAVFNTATRPAASGIRCPAQPGT
ncbi:hypothetical protein [Ramlibacter humi]|uniref:Tannase/feruloyl esterase family alpha/beta hydrolase n=1 Tax=Ramlibacter humi TaxID=2530451 RepID=A0A4Z0BHG7_9BURK|nr:hypothetical protein [Ramlibacter humi]TFY98230.1 hypothetical protein EZ216_16680 [Ramlibacter humi]